MWQPVLKSPVVLLDFLKSPVGFRIPPVDLSSKSVCSLVAFLLNLTVFSGCPLGTRRLLRSSNNSSTGRTPRIKMTAASPSGGAVVAASEEEEEYFYVWSAAAFYQVLVVHWSASFFTNMLL